MPPNKRRGPIPRRRRHDDDDGEEDASTVGVVQEYVSSEGSLSSDAEEDGDMSVASLDDGAQSTPSPIISKQQPQPQALPDGHFKTTAETEAMLNGLKIQDGESVEELNFEESTRPLQDSTQPQQPSLPSQRSHVGGIGRFNSQTVPPPRKSHSIHDDRSRGQPYVGQPGPRGRGRGFPGPHPRGGFGNFNAPVHDSDKQWTHDLHDTINNPVSSKPPVVPASATTHQSTAPNRSFSTTTILGNVPVQVSIPGVEKKTSASMVKKHYTLLPQHRPPLRRDKPVRISIPDEHPRYIFPSTERSFIFIPRAMRPNQHQFKGRGRGSFHGSRRTSVYGGSTYTPSVDMSRRPSIAASQPGSGIHTPTGVPSYTVPTGALKPVVRMPMPNTMSFASPHQNAEVYLGDNAAIVHSPPTTLPMHQPVPQKAVSVADIESPTLKAPPQQSQQPFHQQIPQSIGDSQQKMPHIPEGAVFAQPFQPYPTMQPGFFGMTYPPNPVMMQPTDTMGYPMGMGGPVMNMQAMSNQPPTQQHGPIAHEQSGMVYYYDPSQQQIPSNFAPQMMNMMQPGPYFYPPFPNQHMFYQ